MSSILLLPSLLQGGSWRWPSHHDKSRKAAGHDASTAVNNALVRSLLQRMAPSGRPSSVPSVSNPLEGNLGNLIDLRATLVTRTEDASLTIRTAEGDTVTLTEHAQLQSLKARLTYAPDGTASARGQAGPGRHRDDDDHEGVTRARLREIQLDQSITLSVQGDLSDKELADIKKLVASLGDSLTGLGTPGSAQDKGSDANAGSSALTRIDTQGLGSLAGFELHVEQSIEVTKIHVHRAPTPPVIATAQDPTVTPGVPEGIEPPVATEAPRTSNPGRNPGPAPAKPPVLGRNIPAAPAKPPVLGRNMPAAPSQPATPAWIVELLQSRNSTLLDVLFRHSLPVPHPAPDGGMPLPESPAATR